MVKNNCFIRRISLKYKQAEYIKLKDMENKIIDYIEYDESNNLKIKRGGYYSCEKTIDYNELINLTIKDIYEY